MAKDFHAFYYFPNFLKLKISLAKHLYALYSNYTVNWFRQLFTFKLYYKSIDRRNIISIIIMKTQQWRRRGGGGDSYWEPS